MRYTSFYTADMTIFYWYERIMAWKSLMALCVLRIVALTGAFLYAVGDVLLLAINVDWAINSAGMDRALITHMVFFYPWMPKVRK